MTTLQPLTNRQVQNRLDTYNQGGALERDIRALWHAAGPIIESEVRDQFGEEAADKVRLHYTRSVDAMWVQSVAEYGRRLYAEKSSVPAYIVRRDQLISAIIGRFFETFAEDQQTLRECVTALQRLTTCL